VPTGTVKVIEVEEVLVEEEAPELVAGAQGVDVGDPE
jgi:hypothetical protein